MTAAFRGRRGVPLGQAAALRAAGDALHQQFSTVFSRDTVEEFLDASYRELAAQAATTSWLPLLAERFARMRLQALARVEGLHEAGVPIVLFLCVQNSGRSQMAMGWFQALAEGRAVAWSGGSAPGAELNPVAVEAMAEVSIDISAEFPKPWTPEVLRAADVVVTMGCGDTCPVLPGIRYETWELPDPAGRALEGVRPIRDEIGHRVRRLLVDLQP